MTDHCNFHFGAGPAQLPNSVKQKAAEHIDVYPGADVSVLELSHRSAAFEQLLEDINRKLRQLLQLPNDFEVLLVHGGATAQFDAIPLNLLAHTHSQKPIYLVSGFWSRLASKTAQRINEIESLELLPANSERVFEQLRAKSNQKIPYIYVTPNETIEGIEYYFDQDIGAPLVADMTSCLMTKQIDFTRYGLIFAGAQKTLGIAGLCIVLVRKNLISETSNAPKWLDYAALQKHQSRVNTPPVFAINVLSLMLDWYIENGGVLVCEQAAEEKARLIYDVIDQTDCYQNEIPSSLRSRLNIPFQLSNEKQLQQFLHLARERGLTGLDGHRSVGGVRASMYTAMPLAGAQKLRQLMIEFCGK